MIIALNDLKNVDVLIKKSYENNSDKSLLNLNNIDFRNDLFTESGMNILNDFLKNNPQITKINLSENEIKYKELKNLIKIISKNPNINELDLNQNLIGYEGANILSKNETIETLSIKSNFISNEGAKSIAENKKIKNLNLGNNTIGDVGAIALSKNLSIENLNLQCNKIGDKGAAALSEKNGLQNINLSFNKIGEIGATEISKNNNLKIINLSGNQINDDGATALLENYNIEKLDISNNPITENTLKSMMGYFIPRNKNIPIIVMPNNDFSENLTDIISEKNPTEQYNKIKKYDVNNDMETPIPSLLKLSIFSVEKNTELASSAKNIVPKDLHSSINPEKEITFIKKLS